MMRMRKESWWFVYSVLYTSNPLHDAILDHHCQHVLPNPSLTDHECSSCRQLDDHALVPDPTEHAPHHRQCATPRLETIRSPSNNLRRTQPPRQDRWNKLWRPLRSKQTNSRNIAPVADQPISHSGENRAPIRVIQGGGSTLQTI